METHDDQEHPREGGRAGGLMIMAKPKYLDVALRQAIKASGMTHYAIGQAAGVAPSQIDRFMFPAADPRHRDLRLATAARIAAVIGLELTPTEG
jgi:3-oxoacyl-[acyl-carrier-protein] synthase III